MKDLIWLSHFIPYPVRGGAAQRSYNLLRQAARQYRVSLVAFNRPPQAPAMLAESRREFERFCHRVEFLELPFVWKGPTWWMRLALAPLASEPISVVAYRSQRIEQRWKQILADYSDALVHVDSSDLSAFAGPAIGFPVVVNHHNCESAMASRRASLESNGLKKWVLQGQARKQITLEENLLHRVALNLTVSQEDADSLRAVNSQARFHVVDNGTDIEFFQPADELIEENTIVFAGSLRWYPNQSGLMFFSREVWPLLKMRCPCIRFIVAGQKAPEFLVRWAHSDPQIVFVPDPEDIRPWIARGAVFVCPIRDGGGSRLKLLDAMAMGKAIVTTEVGAEGLRVTSGTHMMIAHMPQHFADEVISLLRDNDKRQRLGAEARSWVSKEYSWPVIGERLMRAYEEASQAAASRMRRMAGQVQPGF